MSEIRTASDLVAAARLEADTLLLNLRGEVDLHTSPDLRTELLDLLGKHSPKRLILNLAQVPYMDSSAIAVLVEAWQRVRKNNGKVLLVELQQRVRSLVGIARLGSIFEICKDEAEAMTK